MSTLIELFKGITTELMHQLPYDSIARRYMPRNNVADLQSLKIAVYVEDNQHEYLGREVLGRTYTFGIAVQQAVNLTQTTIDGDGQEVSDGTDNLTFGDTVLEKVEEIKSLWFPGGSLRDKPIAGCIFSELVHEPVYESIHLVTMGVYTAIVDVTYTESSL